MPLAWVVLTVVSVVCIDQASKAVLLSRLSLNGSVRLSRGVRLRHVVNVGWIHRVRSPMVLLLLWGVAVSSSLLILALGGEVKPRAPASPLRSGARPATSSIACCEGTSSTSSRSARGQSSTSQMWASWPGWGSR